MNCLRENNRLLFTDDMAINYPQDNNMSNLVRFVDKILERVRNMDMFDILKKSFPGTKIGKNLEVLGYGG